MTVVTAVFSGVAEVVSYSSSSSRMPKTRLVRACFYVLLGQLLYLPLAHCGQIQAVLSANIAPRSYTNNITDLLNLRYANDEAAQARVITLVDSLNEQPACHQGAAVQLITSCQSVKQETINRKPSSEKLEQMKSIYAARLANCEQRQTGAADPLACSPIMAFSSVVHNDPSSELPKTSGRMSMEHISDAELTACVETLNSTPQSWTSYSNGRQQAESICDVSRTDVKIQEVINTVGIVVADMAKLHQGMINDIDLTALRQEAEKAWLVAFQQAREAELEDSSKAIQSNKIMFRKWMGDIREEFGDVARDSMQAASDVTVRAREAAESAESYFIASIENVFRSVTGGGAQMSAEVADAHKAALMVRDILEGFEGIVKNMVTELEARFVAHHTTIDSGFATFHQQINNASEKVQQSSRNIPDIMQRAVSQFLRGVFVWAVGKLQACFAPDSWLCIILALAVCTYQPRMTKAVLAAYFLWYFDVLPALSSSRENMRSMMASTKSGITASITGLWQLAARHPTHASICGTIAGAGTCALSFYLRRRSHQARRTGSVIAPLSSIVATTQPSERTTSSQEKQTPQPSQSSATGEVPGNYTWDPATQIIIIPQLAEKSDKKRFTRASTSPPGT